MVDLMVSRGNLLCITRKFSTIGFLKASLRTGVQDGSENHLIGSLHLLCLDISVFL